MVDPASYELSVWDKFYVINISNNEVYDIPNDGLYIPSEDSSEYPGLTPEDIEQLTSAIKIKTEKAQIWVFAWERDIYTLTVWNFIEWPLPTTAEPVHLLVDIDPKKVISETKKYLNEKTLLMYLLKI